MADYLERFARPARALFGTGSVGRYSVIGLTGMSLDFVIFALLIRGDAPPGLATAFSTACGIANNYFLNAWLNFRVKVAWRGALRFFAVGCAGLIASVIGVTVFTFFGTSALAAKLITLPLVLIAQFLANKFWSFRPETGRPLA